MIRTLSAALAAYFFAFTPTAEADPCNFNDGAVAYSWEQVMECYTSVPFNPDDLDNIVGVLMDQRAYSDLDELYDERYQWRSNLAAVANATYPDDFSMHNAIKHEHKLMRNPHVRYSQPFCYNSILTGFIPFDFGATKRFSKGEDLVIFIEDAPIAPDIYEDATGIDPADFVGMKVVSINSVPTLDYFREFGNTRILWDDSDSVHLNAILNRLGYSIRSSTTHDFAPERPEDVMVLESRNGKRITATFPWVFAKRSAMGMYQDPATSSTAEFIEACTQPYQLPFPTAGLGAGKDTYRLDREVDKEKRKFVNRTVRGPSVTSKDFFEVPPGRFDKDIEVIVPLTDAAKVLQYRDDTTVIRFFNTGSWIDVARQGVEHACQNSDNLILDLRRNGGGNDIVFQWLYTHLFPEVDSVVEAGKIATTTRNDNPEFNRVLYWGGILDQFFGASCWGLGPGCWMDIDTEETIPSEEISWFESPSYTENRGGSPVSLSRQIGIGENLVGLYPEFDAASCAGKFDRDNLVILTDASNCSGGYFFVSPFKENEKATVVTMGGYPGEDIPMGICRSGLTIPMSNWPFIVNIAEGFGFNVDVSPKAFSRQVDANMEIFGAYRQNRTDLHFNEPLDYDVRIDAWSDSPETDAYVYQKALEALDKQ